MSFSAAALIGFFLGLAFGVGCALAVMYSIYMGGYRAAVRDSEMPQASQRLLEVKSRVQAQAKERSSTDLAHPRN